MMKATEYYAEFRDPILMYIRNMDGGLDADAELSADGVSATTKLFQRLLSEALEIQKNRDALSPEAQRSILREQNQKWNAIVSLFEKEFGRSPLSRNHFLKVCDKLLAFADKKEGTNV